MGLCREAGAVSATYCNDTVVRGPLAENEAMDRRLLRETGRRLADSYLSSPPLMVGK
jgi:hypothetical protein